MTAPFVATSLIPLTGNDFAPGYYLMGAAGVAFVALLFTAETAGKSLRQECAGARAGSDLPMGPGSENRGGG